jgi:hypothetical protein
MEPRPFKLSVSLELHSMSSCVVLLVISLQIVSRASGATKSQAKGFPSLNRCVTAWSSVR